MEFLKSALIAAEKGFYVHPLRQRSKIPALKDWQNIATRDPKKIQAMWTNGHANSNIGISTTKFKDCEALIVWDIDNKENKMGEYTIERLIQYEGLEFPFTFEVKTPSGGRHLYYKTSSAVRQGVDVLGPGVDVRSKGGNLVGAGSVLDNGPYIAGDGDVAEALPWMVDYCNRFVKSSTTSERLTTVHTSSEHDYNRARDYLSTDATLAIQGQGGDTTTYKTACKCRDFGVSEAECHELMSLYWNNRCSPPWSNAGLLAKVTSAYKSAQNEHGVLSPANDFTPIPQLTDELAELLDVPKASYTATPPKRIQTTYFKDIQPKLTNTYLVEDFLAPEEFCVMYGAPSAGKSFFVLDMALHIAMGIPKWMGKKIKQGLVVYVCAEGGTGIGKRVDAFKKHNKLESHDDAAFCLINQQIDITKDTPEIIEIIKEAETHYGSKAALVIFDTLSCVVRGGSTNDDAVMRVLGERCKEIIEKTKANVCVIHHPGKDPSRGMLGSSVLEGFLHSSVFIEKGHAKVEKQKEIEKYIDLYFALHVVEVGKNEEGDPVTSCVVLQANGPIADTFNTLDIGVGSKPAIALEALKKLIAQAPMAPPAHLNLPDGTYVASVEMWKSLFINTAHPHGCTNKSMTIKRAKETLELAGKIKTDGEFIWPISPI